MGLIDLKIDRIRKSDKWKGRHERIRRMGTNSSTPNQFTPQPLEVQYSMDPELYKAATKGDVDEFIYALERISAENRLPPRTILDQRSPIQNTYLHVAANCGHQDLSCFIVHNFFSLLCTTNRNGDTALHLAARAGHLGVVEVLLEFKMYQYRLGYLKTTSPMTVEEGFRETGWEANEEGNTPLHEAMINHRDSVVSYFMTTHPHTAYYINKEGKSPLYLAVEAGKVEYVKAALRYRVWCQEAQDYLDRLLMNGKSIIHAAILRSNTVLLQEIVKQKPMLLKLKDGNGHNPLDFAASIGFLKGVRLLLKESSMGRL